MVARNRHARSAEFLSASLLDDQPSAVDLLNFKPYAAALRSLILNPETKTPFIIGIIGRWGTGKTTLMRMVERELRPGATVVWFNAWLYTQEKEIWAAFLQSLSTQLIARLRMPEKARFSLRVFQHGLAWERLVYEGPKYLVRALLVALPFVVTSFLMPLTGRILGSLLNSAGIVGSVLLALWYGLRPSIDAVRKEGISDLSLFRPMDFEQHIGSLERFREQFIRLLNALPTDARRLVVFVDDIDRCPPDQALQLLDSIKVFLDIPGCIFLLALDLSVLQKALGTKYPQDSVAQREYLAKIIQLPFHLPPLTAEDLTTYLRELEVSFPDERCREVFLSALARNPREIKRVINSYSLIWHLARASQTSLQPVRLAKVIAIQQGFGDLFAVLREQPEWLNMLERALRAQGGEAEIADPTSQPDVTIIGTSPDSGVPPAISPFLQEPALQRMLTMHPLLPYPEDDANFSYISPAEIARYFTLTRRIGPGAGVAEDGVTDLESGAGRPELVFPERYTLVQVLARGGMGEVYLAEDRETGKKVALKTLALTLADNPSWVSRFSLESRIPQHPNIVSILDTGIAHGTRGQAVPFYVMEFIGGQTLADILASEERLSLMKVRDLLVPVLDALECLGAGGIVHRDIKPANILIDTDGVPKLMDFGIAVHFKDGQNERTADSASTLILGTPHFMSPEQLMGKAAGLQSDLYSFGVILFEALTGQPAVASDLPGRVKQLGEPPRRPSDLVEDLPPQLDDVVIRLLARDPADRYPDAASAKSALLEAIAAHLPSIAEEKVGS
jgi:hypothetical protein